MLIFIYGDDTFSVQEKVQAMRARFLDKFDKSGINLSEFNIQKKGTTIGDVLQAVSSPPFLSEKRMIIIRELVSSTKKVDMTLWEDRLSKVPDSSLVLLWETLEPTSLEKKPLFKALKEAADVHYYPFPSLQGKALTDWVHLRVNQVGAKIDFGAVSELIKRVGSDLWRMHSEIEKLSAYTGQKPINSSDVELLVHGTFEDQIFAFVDVIAKQDRQGAVSLLKNQRLAGVEDFYLLNMLARQLRILIGTRDLIDANSSVTKQQVADKLKVHPFVAQKAIEQARHFTLETLIDAHAFLLEKDVGIKSGKISDDMAVDLSLVKFVS